MATSDQTSPAPIAVTVPRPAFPVRAAGRRRSMPGTPLTWHRRSFNDFVRDDTGAVTIEFTVLVPLFVLLMVLFVDVSVIYLTNSEMISNARDISRQMSVLELTTADQVRDYAAAHLFLGNREYQVEPAFGADMTVTISLPVAQAAIFGFFMTEIIGDHLFASATTRREPFE
jgi:Flp pilus assembly pilin Flp